MLMHCHCGTCGGSLDYESEHEGRVVPCPLCGQDTVLATAAQETETSTDPLPTPAAVAVGSATAKRRRRAYWVVMVLLALGYGWLAHDKDWGDLGGLLTIGYRESIHRLVPVGMLSPAGDRLALGYKTTRYSALLGTGLSDDGYVLLVESRPDEYFPLPADFERLQAEGALPMPLPAYRIPTYQYVLCYAFYWVVPPLVAVAWFFGRKPRKPAPPR